MTKNQYKKASRLVRMAINKFETNKDFKYLNMMEHSKYKRLVDDQYDKRHSYSYQGLTPDYRFYQFTGLVK